MLAVSEAANDMRMSQLVRTIENEIIPRLMLAHRVVAEAPAAVSGDPAIARADVEHFAKLMLAHDEEPSFEAVMSYRARGVSIERLYLDLLAPAARYLGDLWNEDLCTFTDVTVGLGRLQRVLRELSPAFGSLVDHPAAGRNVLLLPTPGEQHTFGLVIVGEFFRRAGWSVSGAGWCSGADAGSLVAAEWFDAIGFSLGAEIHRDALAETIRAVKHESCNRDIVVLVGGPLFAQHPGHVEAVGADGMTMDGRDAPLLAERLIARDSTMRASRRVKEPAGRSSS
ncbi:MAG: cobalamin B12-binding domain-containing protein [Myxococcales bacterium]|nr:cobalamin B12-binding domain-containing protein [Myxococcales bacterium]